MRTHCNRNPKAMLTKNQEPLTKNQEPKDQKPAPNARRKKPDKSGESFEIFCYWRDVMGKNPSTTKPTKKRIANVEARLKEGYSVEQIKTAILGCSKTPFNMGQNADGKVWDDLELICRNGENVERFHATGGAQGRSGGILGYDLDD